MIVPMVFEVTLPFGPLVTKTMTAAGDGLVRKFAGTRTEPVYVEREPVRVTTGPPLPPAICACAFTWVMLPPVTDTFTFAKPPEPGSRFGVSEIFLIFGFGAAVTAAPVRSVSAASPA